jgi:hypothetical protein
MQKRREPCSDYQCFTRNPFVTCHNSGHSPSLRSLKKKPLSVVGMEALSAEITYARILHSSHPTSYMGSVPLFKHSSKCSHTEHKTDRE